MNFQEEEGIVLVKNRGFQKYGWQGLDNDSNPNQPTLF